jgi:hypothetical protein
MLSDRGCGGCVRGGETSWRKALPGHPFGRQSSSLRGNGSLQASQGGVGGVLQRSSPRCTGNTP